MTWNEAIFFFSPTTPSRFLSNTFFPSQQTHQSVHTGSRPYACPHPGCTKTFSVASNMRRHLRKHGQASELEQTSSSEPAPELELDQDELNHPHSREPDSGSLGSSEGSGFGSGEGEVDADEEYDALGRVTQTPTLYTHAPTSTLSSDTTVTSAQVPAPSPFPRPPTSQAYFEWMPSPAGHIYDNSRATLGAGSGVSSESAPDARPSGGTQTRPRRTSPTP